MFFDQAPFIGANDDILIVHNMQMLHIHLKIKQEVSFSPFSSKTSLSSSHYIVLPSSANKNSL